MAAAALASAVVPARGVEPLALLRSYAYAENVARREAANFYPAFRVLPPCQRRAMCALYAFFRIADDLSDEPGAVEEKRAALSAWRDGLRLAMTGCYSHRLHPALHHAVSKYGIPLTYVEAVLDGVAMDLEPVAYDTFADLRQYCYRVASAVGLACIHIWGFSEPRALEYAENAGIAFQLTNILRDLGEDAARGRVYLPREDLERFGYDAAGLRAGERGDNFRALMRFQVERAEAFYDAALPLLTLLEPPGRAIFFLMASTYRELLHTIQRRDYDVFTRRARVGTLRKLVLAARALPYRWGWT